MAAGNRQLNPVIPIRPLWFASRTIARPSSALIASGFSHSTCAPRANAAVAMGRCEDGGVAITTMSGRAFSSISSQRVKTPGTP